MTHTHRPTLRRSLTATAFAALVAFGTVATPFAQPASAAPTYRVVVPAPVTVGAINSSAASVPARASAPVRAASPARAATSVRPASTRVRAASTNQSAGQRAADRARSLVGRSYRWGATGPNAYDCSGVTLRAWQAAGVTIPRVSRDQASSLNSVSRANLRPGDLVFFNRPVSHVAIYVGNGEIVEASRSTNAVVVRKLNNRSGIVGYGRP